MKDYLRFIKNWFCYFHKILQKSTQFATNKYTLRFSMKFEIFIFPTENNSYIFFTNTKHSLTALQRVF